MKFCPYCGAALVGGAAPFCAECGKAMPPSEKHQTPTQDQTVRAHPGTEKKSPLPAGKKPPASARKSKKSVPQKKPDNTRSASKQPVKKKPDPAYRPKPDPRDEGYDGYYDDIKPVDNGHVRDRTDPALVKRIVLLSAGALLIVIFSVLVMYLL